MNYLSNFFVSIDQLGNVLAGGNPDNTISARIGYYNHLPNGNKRAPSHWLIFKYIVDFTF